MTSNTPKTWQDLARAASVEQDSEKLMQLVSQLNLVLEQDHKDNQPESKTFGQTA
jgi:hypothetical protein